MGSTIEEDLAAWFVTVGGVEGEGDELESSLSSEFMMFPSLSPTTSLLDSVVSDSNVGDDDDGISIKSKVIAIMVKITAVPSIIGSAYITYQVLSTKSKRSKTYHRLLLPMSFFDLLSSTALFIGSWAIPKGTEGVYIARGNHATCKAQGFFTQLGIVTPMYNGMLAIYYYLSINRGWKERQIHTVEKYFHAFPLLWGFGTTIFLAATEQYSSATLWCWIGIDKFTQFRWYFYYGPVMVMLVLTTIIMIIIYKYVRDQEKACDKYHFARQEQEQNAQQRHRQPKKGFRASVMDPIINSLQTRSKKKNTKNEVTSNERDIIASDDDDVGILDSGTSRIISSAPTPPVARKLTTISLRNSIIEDDKSVHFDDNFEEEVVDVMFHDDVVDDYDGDNNDKNDDNDEYDVDDEKDDDDDDDDDNDNGNGNGNDTNEPKHGTLAKSNHDNFTFRVGSTKGRHETSTDQSNESGESVIVRALSRMERKMKQKKQRTKQSRQVMIQSLWYIIAFYLSFIFAISARMVGSVSGKPAPFWLLLLFSIFSPLQGFMNFLVYMKPRRG